MNKKGAVALVLVLGAHFALPVRALEEVPVVDVSALLEQGLQAENTRQWNRALGFYLQAVTQDPQNHRVRLLLHRAADRLRERREKFLQKNRKGLVKEAERRWTASRAKRREWRARVREGNRWRRQKKYVEAAWAFHRVLAESPAFPAAVRSLTKCQRKAKARLRKGKFATPQHELALQAVVAYNDGRWQKAYEIFEEVLTHPVLPAGLVSAPLSDYRARALRLWNFQQAEAKRLKWFAQGVAAYEGGRLREARSIFQRILNEHSRDRDSRAYLDLLDRVMQQVDEDVSDEMKKREIGERMIAGSQYYIQQQYFEAMEEFLRVLDLDSDHREAKEFLGEVRQSMAREDIFIPTLVLEGDAEEKFQEGLLFFGNEDYERALSAFEEALLINPRHREARTAVQKIRQTMEQEEQEAALFPW